MRAVHSVAWSHTSFGWTTQLRHATHGRNKHHTSSSCNRNNIQLTALDGLVRLPFGTPWTAYLTHTYTGQTKNRASPGLTPKKLCRLAARVTSRYETQTLTGPAHGNRLRNKVNNTPSFRDTFGFPTCALSRWINGFAVRWVNYRVIEVLWWDHCIETDLKAKKIVTECLVRRNAPTQLNCRLVRDTSLSATESIKVCCPQTGRIQTTGSCQGELYWLNWFRQKGTAECEMHRQKLRPRRIMFRRIFLPRVLFHVHVGRPSLWHIYPLSRIYILAVVFSCSYTMAVQILANDLHTILWYTLEKTSMWPSDQSKLLILIQAMYWSTSTRTFTHS